MKKIIKLPHFVFSSVASAYLEKTVGSLAPEKGGLLFGNPKTGYISHFYFDKGAPASFTTFSLVAENLNPVIKDYNSQGLNLMGFPHSHPPECEMPSEQDISLGLKQLKRFDSADLDYFLIPIIQSKATGEFKMRLFCIHRDMPDNVFEVAFSVETPASSSLTVPSKLYNEIFVRIRDSVDLPRMYNSEVHICGLGGGASFALELARSGVNNFCIYDNGKVEIANLATSAYFFKDIGRNKAEVIAERILEINPLAKVEVVTKNLLAIPDDEFDKMLVPQSWRDHDIEARLLCACTDSFECQARLAKVGLKFGIPTLAAQLYRGGAAGEVVYTYPGLTHQCLRCSLSKRYDAYLKFGFVNDAGSEGAQYGATVMLNERKLFIALAILHHGTNHSFWGDKLQRIGQRNCLQLRYDPDVEQKLGLANFVEAFAKANFEQLFCGETIWRPQHPENLENGYDYNCPDCGGTGNIRDSIGKCSDTRIIKL